MTDKTMTEQQRAGDMYMKPLIARLRGSDTYRRPITLAGVLHDERCLEAADAIDQLRKREVAQAAEIARCHARLEIDYAYRLEGGELVRFKVPMETRVNHPDAVECRDIAIKNLTEIAKRQEAEIERLRGALEQIEHAQMTEPDEDTGDEVLVWMSADEMQDIARAALKKERE